MMQLDVVVTAQRYCEFIADLATEGAGLRKFDVVGVAWGPLANETWLGRDKAKVGLVATPDRLTQFEAIISGSGSGYFRIQRRVGGGWRAGFVGWRGRLEKLVMGVYLEDTLIRRLDDARIIGQERVLCRHSPVCP